MSDGSVEDAWYSTEELIIWTRVLLDHRLRRKSVKHGFPDQGLIRPWRKVRAAKL